MTPTQAPSQAASRLGRILRAGAALVALLVVIVGTPAALVVFVGWPLPHGLPTLDELLGGLTESAIPERVVVNILALLCWAAWAQFALGAALEMVALVRGRTAPRLPLAGPTQAAAGWLVGVLLLALVPLTTRTSGGGPAIAALSASTVPAPVAAAVEVHASPAVERARLPARAAREHPVYVVKRYDTLWGIAERCLGDGLRWPQIYQLNEGREQPGGGRLVDPDRIYPGWRLRLPVDARLPNRPDQPPTGSQPPPSTPHQPGEATPTASTTPPGRSKTPTTSTNAPPSTSTAPAPTTSTAGPAAPARPTPTPDAQPSTELPAGSVIGASLLVAMLAAVEILRRRRARHRLPADPAPSINHALLDPDDADEAELVAWLHQLANRPDPADADLHSSPNRGDQARKEDGRGFGHAGSHEQPRPETPRAGGSDQPAAHADPAHPPSPPPPLPLPAPPVVASSAEQGPGPAETLADQITTRLTHRPLISQPVALASHTGQERTIDLDRLGGLALTGDGAAGVARALAVATLAAHPPLVAEVLTVGDVLPGQTAFPGLRRLPTVEAALRELEVELVRRSRMADAVDAADIAALRAVDPGEPLPVLVLVARLDRQHAQRILALASLGQRLGLALIALVGDVQDEALAGLPARLTVDGDGTPVTAAPASLAGRLAGARLHHLTAEAAERLLITLAAARTEPDPDTPNATQHHQPDATEQPDQAREPVGSPTRVVSQATPQPEASVSAPPTPPSSRQAAQPLPPSGSGLIQVRLLGRVGIEVEGRSVLKGMRTAARELLGYFVLHPDGATQASVTDRLWPEVELGREQQRFWNALGNLRSHLRAATGRRDLHVIEHTGDGYRLEPGVLDTDIWRFQHALAKAQAAADTPGRITALEQASAAYSGPLAGGEWGWAEPERRSLHDKALDALVRLAELREATNNPGAAVVALERAIEVDPVAEDCYRRLMRLHAQRGQPEAITRTLERLKTALEEIDADPAPATLRLVADLRRHSLPASSGPASSG